MQNQKKKKWTVFFLVKSVDGTINYAIEMINELRRIHFGGDVSVVLCLHVADEHIAGIESGIPVSVNAEQLPEKLVTVFYKLEAAPDENFLNQLTPVYEKRSAAFEITDPLHLTAFFREYIRKYHSAEQHMLFTWGHGSCYGIFKHQVKNAPDAGAHFLAHGVTENGRSTQPGSSMASDSTLAETSIVSSEVPSETVAEFRYLTTEGLSEAITAAFGEQKIDVIVMMNCYMQFFDAGYSLASAARYLVAPETYMYFDGYNYTAIFNALAKNPAIGARQLSQVIVQSFQKKNILDVVRDEEVKDNTALFANDLSFYPAISDTITDLFSSLEASLSKTRGVIIAARGKCIPLNSATQVIDFYSLVYHLQEMLKTEKDLCKLNDLLALRQKMVVEKYVGKLFSAQNTFFPSGFTVFFPITEEGLMVNQTLTEPYEQTNFFSTSGWGRFVSHFQ